VTAQIVLTLVYVAGGVYMFVIRPRRHRRHTELSPPSVVTAA
jgi:hypothetical protein